jgi:hypothetical protein
MKSWSDFAALEPDMAQKLRSQLASVPIVYLATTRRDGAPRVHPVCPIFAADGMFVAVPETSPKRHDLRQDGRYALHALPGTRDDEFYCTGRAALVDPGARRQAVVEGAGHTTRESDLVFELGVGYVMTAYWEMVGQPGTYAVRERWRDGTT